MLPARREDDDDDDNVDSDGIVNNGLLHGILGGLRLILVEKEGGMVPSRLMMTIVGLHQECTPCTASRIANGTASNNGEGSHPPIMLKYTIGI